MNAPFKFDDHTKLNWWQSALKGDRRPLPSSGEPMTGYYRARKKNKQTGEETLYAVAYWWHNGKCFCRVNGKPMSDEQQLERMIASWPFVSEEPIPYDVYQSVVAGNSWPDQHVTPKADPAVPPNQPLGTQQAAPAVAGSAAPPAERTTEVDNSPQAVLARAIEEAKRGLPLYVKIDNEDQAKRAAELRSNFLALARKAEKAMELELAPFKEQTDKIKAIWQPLKKEAENASYQLRDGSIKDWEKFKREQAAAAEKQAKAASAAAGKPVEAKSNAPAPSSSIKGATGRTTIVKEIKVARIDDQDAVYQWFKNSEPMKAVLQTLANAAVNAGITVPGVSVENDVSIR